MDRSIREGPNREESETTVYHDEAVHQMSDDQFEPPLEGRGEAPRVERSGEVLPAMRGDVRSGNDDLYLMESLMERVDEWGNLLRALKRVQRNQGSPGVDGLTVEEFPAYLREHW